MLFCLDEICQPRFVEYLIFNQSRRLLALLVSDGLQGQYRSYLLQTEYRRDRRYFPVNPSFVLGISPSVKSIPVGAAHLTERLTLACHRPSGLWLLLCSAETLPGIRITN